MLELKIGDRFIHRDWPNSVCEIVGHDPARDYGNYRYRSVAGQPIRSWTGTRTFADARTVVVKILTDEAPTVTIDAPESLYPPWSTA